MQLFTRQKKANLKGSRLESMEILKKGQEWVGRFNFFDPRVEKYMHIRIYSKTPIPSQLQELIGQGVRQYVATEAGIVIQFDEGGMTLGMHEIE